MYNIHYQNGVYSIQEDGKTCEVLANSVEELKIQLEEMIKACEEWEKEYDLNIKVTMPEKIKWTEIKENGDIVWHYSETMEYEICANKKNLGITLS